MINIALDCLNRSSAYSRAIAEMIGEQILW